MVFFKFLEKTPCILVRDRQLLIFISAALQVRLNGRVSGKELFIDTLNFFKYIYSAGLSGSRLC